MSGPFLVRDQRRNDEPVTPSRRRIRRDRSMSASSGSPVPMFRRALFVLGICALGYYSYSLANEHVYQAYENWSFDQQIAGRSSGSFADYLREQTSFGFLTGPRHLAASQPTARPVEPSSLAVPQGSILGRVSVPRLGISAIVREGADAATLSRAVGHVPSTALPGQTGNFSIAAHRDTLFRALRDVRIGDQVEFQSTAGEFAYRVIVTQIVRPSDVSVLQADGGPAFLRQVSSRPTKLLTMITCYPFNYIGAAPRRFIVQAEQMEPDIAPTHNSAAHPVRSIAGPTRRRPATAILRSAAARPKKRGFWHRLFHVG